MVLSTHASWGKPERNRDFILKRLVRIAPLYWVLTTLKIALLMAFPIHALRGELEPWHTAASYLFLPAANGSTGQVTPVLPMGWTLNLEMFFYALFAVALVSTRRPLHWIVPSLVGLGTLGILAPELWYPVRYYIDPILIEFAFGMMIGRLVLSGFKIPPAAAGALALLSVVAIGSAEYLPGFAPHWRIYVWGVPGALLLLAMISLEGRFDRLPFHRFGLLLGDASYAIYLSHGFVLTAVGVLCQRAGFTGLPATFGVLAACLVLTVVVGVFIHRWVEAPMSRWLNAHLFPHRKFPQAMSAVPVKP